jgi:hypothetical protein
MPIRQAITAQPAPRIFSTLPCAGICARRRGRRTRRRSYSCSDQRIGRIPASTSLRRAAPALVVVAGVREDAASTGDADMVCLRLVVERSATSAGAAIRRRTRSCGLVATMRSSTRVACLTCHAPPVSSVTRMGVPGACGASTGSVVWAASMSMMSRADPSSTSTTATFRCLGAAGLLAGPESAANDLRSGEVERLATDKCRCDHRASGAIALLAVIDRVTRHLSNQSRLAFHGKRPENRVPTFSNVIGLHVRQSARATDRRDPCGGRTPRSIPPAPRAATSALRRCRAYSGDRQR